MIPLGTERVGNDEVGYSHLVVKPSVQTVMPPKRAPMEILTREEILRRRQAGTPKPISIAWAMPEVQAVDMVPIVKKKGWPKGKPRK